MTAGSTIIVDTNVLLTATTPSRPLHEQALKVMNDWPNQGIVLCTSGQILREYSVVATRPEEVNGLGLSIRDVLDNLVEISSRMRFLVENQIVVKRLRGLMEEINCKGKQIHDANIVATALTHNIEKLVTANPGDFYAFEQHIEVLALKNLPH